ncbi:universal stress protein [Asanoa sp. NPDC049573]|uniref:universal stress protein n=1 Tax=Asanoa sp. NPDC049573 TaxID=3155396 RepID=UPI0034415BB2
MSGTDEAVVVGVDGSASATRAVRFAAREAASRHRPLLVTHAFTWALVPTVLGPGLASPGDVGLRTAAQRLVSDAVEVAEKAAPGLVVSGEVRDGAPATVLLHHARQAHMIVIGDRGLGGFTGLILGSVAVQVSAYAPECPVLVVKGDADRAGPVVVGVDGSPISERAIAFAFEEAAIRRAALVAVLAWRYPEPIGPAGDMLPEIYDQDDLLREEARVLESAVAPWCARYPAVRVTRRLYPGRPSKVLVEESHAAQLTVVGGRGRGGFKGLLLGSVSHAVLHHAQSPVAIVHK